MHKKSSGLIYRQLLQNIHLILNAPFPPLFQNISPAELDLIHKNSHFDNLKKLWTPDPQVSYNISGILWTIRYSLLSFEHLNMKSLTLRFGVLAIPLILIGRATGRAIDPVSVTFLSIYNRILSRRQTFCTNRMAEARAILKGENADLLIQDALDPYSGATEDNPGPLLHVRRNELGIPVMHLNQTVRAVWRPTVEFSTKNSFTNLISNLSSKFRSCVVLWVSGNSYGRI